MNIDPNYILSRPERYSKAIVAEARDEMKARRTRREAEKVYPAADELTTLLITARKCRSRSKLIALKAKIEAITGTTYHID